MYTQNTECVMCQNAFTSGLMAQKTHARLQRQHFGHFRVETLFWGYRV